MALPTAGRASCDNLVAWAKKEGLWIENNPTSRSPEVLPGSLVIYTNGNKLPGSQNELDAIHVGVVIRLTPYLMSLEGNASLGGAFTPNGEAVVLRKVDTNRVYGFIKARSRTDGR